MEGLVRVLNLQSIGELIDDKEFWSLAIRLFIVLVILIVWFARSFLSRGGRFYSLYFFVCFLCVASVMYLDYKYGDDPVARRQLDQQLKAEVRSLLHPSDDPIINIISTVLFVGLFILLIPGYLIIWLAVGALSLVGSLCWLIYKLLHDLSQVSPAGYAIVLIIVGYISFLILKKSWPYLILAIVKIKLAVVGPQRR